jgi:hypothetical protein
MRGERANVFILSGVFALTFVLLYGGASVLSAYVPWRVPMMLPLDGQLPLVPGAAIVYLTIGPMLLLAPFMLRDLEAILPLFAALMLETAVAARVFHVVARGSAGHRLLRARPGGWAVPGRGRAESRAQ